MLAFVIKSFTRLRLFFGIGYVIVRGNTYCWHKWKVRDVFTLNNGKQSIIYQCNKCERRVNVL